MKATVLWLGALLLAGAAATPARAGWFYPCCPNPRPCIPQAPDACGPGYYAATVAGEWYGPNYNLQPSYPPFNGMIFPPGGPGGNGGGGGGGGNGGIGGSPSFPTHPWARSPRDYFMIDP